MLHATSRTSLLALAGALAAAPALGQGQSIALEEVMVTAQKRTESLQDIPVSVASFNQQELEMRGIDDLKDIGAEIPNLYINPFNNDPTAIRLFIRGIGQNDVQITQDPSVALYTDGVYVGTSFGAGFEGVDIERLEVLRGPLGTLYGSNATGGAVKIITRRASTERVEFRQDLTFGDLNKFQSKSILNVPLGDSFAAKVNYMRSKRDGYVENNGPGEDFGEEDRDSIVLDLRWEANRDITVDYRFETAENKDTQRLEQVRELSDGALAGFNTFNEDVSSGFLDEVTSLREIINNDQEVDAHSLWAEWRLSDNTTLKSITGYRELDSFTCGDALATSTGDFTAIGRGVGAVNVSCFGTEFEQFSQELQVLGSYSQWQYTAGLYYYEDESTQDASSSVLLGQSGITDLTETENESVAAFAQATWNPHFMSQRWEFTLGARYSHDERQADRVNNRATVPFTGSFDNDFDNFNPSFTVGFDITQDVNVYGKVVTGYKSGGTSTRSANAELFARGFEEEDIVSYELGFKGDLWQRRARLNAALFYMELDGLQTSVQTDPVSPGGRDFLPIDGNEIFGAELDLTLLLTQGLTLSASYGYLDTQLGEEVVESPAGDFELIDEFAPAPENSYNIALDYTRPLSNGNLDFSTNFGWQDEVNTSINTNDTTVIDDYGLWRASVSWSNIRMAQLPGSLRAMLWGRNLTDEEYGLVNTAAWSTFGAPDVQTFGDPRTWGVTLTYRY